LEATQQRLILAGERQADPQADDPEGTPTTRSSAAGEVSELVGTIGSSRVQHAVELG